MKKRIILASASGGRKALLDAINIKYEIIPSGYEEDHSMKLGPEELVRFLATLKARDVATHEENALVIGADTMVVYGKEVIGKPKNEEEAFEILTKLQGKTHKIITGYAVFDTDTDDYIVDSDSASITFRKMTSDEIRNYIKTGEPMGKAGAYASQGVASIFIDKISGHFSTVVGLPVHKLLKTLSKMGYDVSKDMGKNK
jgi:septum formation protein